MLSNRRKRPPSNSCCTVDQSALKVFRRPLVSAPGFSLKNQTNLLKKWKNSLNYIFFLYMANYACGKSN